MAEKGPALFSGKLKPMEAVSLTMAAAEASNLSFEQMATSLPQAAQGGAIAQASPEELLAYQSVLSARFKSGDEAATAIKGFSTKVGLDPRMAGKGITEAFKMLQSMPEEERKDFLKDSQELNQAYVVFGEELEKIELRTKELAQKG